MTALLERFPGSSSTNGGTPGEPRLPSGPRSRRPLMVAVSALAVLVSTAAFASLYSSSDHRSAVLIVTSTIRQGETITAGDLGQTTAALAGGLTPIPVTDAPELRGKRAAVTIPAGSLLVPADLTEALQVPSRDAVVGLALKDGQLPAGGLEPGDHVMIVQTGPYGTPTSADAETGVLVPSAAVFSVAAPSSSSSSGSTALVSVGVSQSLAATVSAAAVASEVSLVLLPGSSS